MCSVYTLVLFANCYFIGNLFHSFFSCCSGGRRRSPFHCDNPFFSLVIFIVLLWQKFPEYRLLGWRWNNNGSFYPSISIRSHFLTSFRSQVCAFGSSKFMWVFSSSLCVRVRARAFGEKERANSITKQMFNCVNCALNELKMYTG